jgi:hypothetical protein
MSIYYAVQGLRNGQWTTLFAPFHTSNDAMAMLANLKVSNPACKYRVRWFNKINPDNSPVVEVR